MIIRDSSLLSFKINKVVLMPNLELDANLGLSYTLNDSQTSQVIFQSSIFEPSQVSSLTPVPLQQSGFSSVVIAFYIRMNDDQKLLGSALIDFNQNLISKKLLKIPSDGEEILNVEIEFFNEEDIETPHQSISETNKGMEEINRLLWIYNIDDINIVPEEIEEVKEDIAFYNKRKKHDDEKNAKKKLLDLERILKLYNEINPKISLLEGENLEEELKQGLTKYDIENLQQIEEKINETKESISFYLKRKKLEDAKIEKSNLAELEKLHSIYIKLRSKSMIEKDPSLLLIGQRPDKPEKSIETSKISIPKNQKNNKDVVKFEGEKPAVMGLLHSDSKKIPPHPLLTINPIEIETQKRIDVIEGLMDDIKSMPFCAEKFLTSILCYFYYKTYSFDPELNIHRKIEFINPNAEFNNFIGFLQQNGEDDVSENFRMHFENQEWERLIWETEKILKEYRPVNLREMDRLIKKSIKNSGDLEGKDIILLIGATGSGKSTTTHFLCGSKMEYVTEDGISDIKATYIQNPALKGTVISSRPQSETRYVTHIPLNLANTGETVYLCDTPGLMDTNGAEVDMANTISIVEYAKKCRSVRPLILLSSKTEGGRFEGVQKLAHTLGRLITDFNKYSISFTYAFTNYHKSDALNIHGKVNSIISSQENSDAAFFHILKDIRDKTRDGVLTINPVKDDHQEIIRKIMERDPILDPKNAFERFITEDSRALLKHQVALSKTEIEKALNSLDYEMIRYKLDELQYIGRLFTQFQPQYIECVESVIRTTKEIYKKTILQFNSYLDNNGTLDENTINHYKKIYRAIKISDDIRKKHLREETPSSNGMLENIVDKLSLAQSCFKVEDVDDFILSTWLKNCKILSESFEELTPLYKSLCHKYVDFIENLLATGSADLKNNNFADFANSISETDRYLGITREYLGYANLDEKLNFLKNQFISSLKEWYNISITPLKKERIEKSDIEVLKVNISIIKEALGVHSLHELIAINELDNLISSIKEEYQAYFEKSKAQVLSIINSDTSCNFSIFEANFDEFVLLMEVPDIECLIAASYREMLNSVMKKINVYKREAKDIIKSFINSPDSVDFAPLHGCLACLESWKWIEKFSEAKYTNKLSGIENEIKFFIDKLKVDLGDIDLGYEFSLNVSKGYSIVQKMREVSLLKEFFPSVENCHKKIIRIFRKRVHESLEFIRRELNPETANEELKMLRELRLKYTQGEEARESAEILEGFVRNNGFANIEDVDEKIKEIENLIQKSNNRMEEGSIDVDKVENSYQYIEECKKIPELFELTEAISKSILENLMQIYNRNLDSLTQYFNSIPSKIKDESFTDFESIKAFSHQAALRFKEMSLISTKSPSLSKYFDMEPDYRRYCTKLDELRDILSEELRLSDKNSRFQRMSSLLVIVTEFAIVNDDFKSLSSMYEKNLSRKLNQTCKSILESIEIHKFKRANKLIKCLDEATWNDNKDIVKDRAQFIIESILSDAKGNALNINNSKLDHSLIPKIIINIHKVNLAKKTKIFTLFEKPKRKTLIELENETTRIFWNKIMEFLNSIIITAQAFKFNEAEEKIKDIQDLNTELDGEIIPLEIQKIRTWIDDLRLNLIQSINNCTIKDLKEFPQILEIEEAANNYQVYREALNEIIGFINGMLETAKNEFPNKNHSEKKEVIDEITSILGFLPKEIKENVVTLVEDLKKNIKREKKEVRNKIDDQARKENISELCKLLRELNKQKNQSDMQYVESKLREILNSAKSEINAALYKKDWNIVFDKASIFTSKDELIDLINGSETILSEIYQCIDQLIKRNLNTLINIESKNSSEELVEAFRVYVAFMEFNTKISKDLKNSDIFGVNTTIAKMLTEISNFYERLHRDCIKELKDFNNLRILNIILKRIKERDDFLKIFKEFLVEHKSDRFYDNYQQTLKIQPYSFYVESLNEEVYKLSVYFKNLKIEFSEIKHPVFLEIISYEIQDKWNELNKYEEIKNHLDSDVIDFEKTIKGAFESLCNEIDKIVKKAASLIDKENIRNEDFKEIQSCYSILINFEEYLIIKGLNWNETVGNIKNKIIDRAYNLRRRAESSTNSRVIAEAMVSIKDISNNFPLLKKEMDEIIDTFFEKFKRKRNKELLVAITQELESHESGLGLTIIMEHKFFEAVMQKIWTSKTQQHGIEFALENIKGVNINKKELESKYKIYDKKFNQIQAKFWKISKNIKVRGAIDQMIGEIKNYSKKLTVDSLNPDLEQLKDSYPELLAYLANLWGLINIEKYQEDENDEEQKSSIFAPHPIQVLSIFRMLSIGYTKGTIFGNNLVEILTGEGKSITLAFLSSILALIGFKIYCACYSSYLSKRDFDYFTDLYSTLGILNWIEYGTFGTLCNNFINTHGDIREIAENLIKTGEMKKQTNKIADRPTVLLIDEVDVFFSESFYGKTYNSAQGMRHSTIKELTDYIWRNRKTIKINELLNTSVYNNCCREFPGFEILVERAARGMVRDVNNFNAHEYIIQGDKIAYRQHDGYITNLTFGYETLFAYYNEKEKGKITQASLKNKISLSIDCGNYSYAEIPHKFNYIMGVTGTLETLEHYERNIIENEYNIALSTFMPSVFGKNNRIFRSEKDVHVENKDDYHITIIKEIESQIKGKTEDSRRAVFVFFEDEDKLMKFFNYSGIKDTDYDIQLITEVLNAGDRAMLIKKATVPNTVTLLTRVFGRGTDFKCLNREVETNKGVHVIQTFLAESRSEETQIKGRTARQGQQGSYSMVLLDTDLGPFNITIEDVEYMRNKGNFYESINAKRDEFNMQKNQTRSDAVKRAKAQHDRSMEYIDSIEQNDKRSAKEFLLEASLGLSTVEVSRAIIIMNAGQQVLRAAKNTVGTIFSRISDVLAAKQMSAECFKLQYCIYRDYNFNDDKILQISPWAKYSDTIDGFLRNIRPEDGFTNGAVELGLWHANKAIRNYKISQVFLLGDFTAENRQQRGWVSSQTYSKFSNIIDVNKELAKIVEKHIPVHAIYNNSKAGAIYSRIAENTRGQKMVSEFNSDNMLIDFICGEILKKIDDEHPQILNWDLYPSFNRDWY